MHIVHVITTIERGGAENQLSLLAKLQVELGNTVMVVFLKGKEDLRESLEKCGVKLLNLSDKSFIGQIFAIRKLLRNSFIFHSHLPRAELVVRFASINRQIKWVVSRHNSEKFWPSAPKSISRTLSKLATSKTQAIICISNAVSSYLVTTGEINKKDFHKLKVILYGREVPAGYETALEKPRLFSFTLGVAARLEEQKDFPTLLLGLAQVLTESKDNWTLKVAGSGSLESRLKRRVTNLNLDSRVIWMGKIQNMEQFYSDIDIFVLPSKYEGFGLVLLEAISYRIPIISSDIATSREILGDDYPGLFPVGDCMGLASIILGMRDQSLREKCISAYQANLSKFDGKEMAKQVFKVYESCI